MIVNVNIATVLLIIALTRKKFKSKLSDVLNNSGFQTEVQGPVIILKFLILNSMLEYMTSVIIGFIHRLL